MGPTSACWLTLGISLFFFIGSIAFGIYRHVSDLKSDRANLKSKILTPLQIVLVGFFLALVVILYPVYHFGYFADQRGIFKILRSFSLSVQHTLQIFVLNIDFNIIKDFVVDSGKVDRVLGVIYSTYATIMYVLAPAMIASFILSLLKETSARIKYALSFGADIYVMSELNAKSLALATDIKKQAGRKLIVFAGVQKKDEDEDSELIDEAKHLGAICFKSDICDIGLKRLSKKIKRKLYFISEKEDENISKALAVIGDCRGNKNLNSKNTQFYVFATSVESEILLNSADIGDMKVRRVNDNKNLTWKTLRENSIFNDAVDCEEKDAKGEKQLNIAIIGCGNYGMEFLKAVCWLGQMPNYRLTVHVFDKDKDVEEKVRFVAPGLFERNKNFVDGECNFKIDFHPDTDVTSDKFIKELASVGRVTSVFVTLGSDELNISTATRLRIEFLRKGYPSDSPSIYPIVYSSTLHEIADGGEKLVIPTKDKDGNNLSYNLKFIGTLKDRFSVVNIELERLENMAFDYHKHWANLAKEEEREQALADAVKEYAQYEYPRASSMAQTIYGIYIVEYIKATKKEGEKFTQDDIVLYNDYEHRRWSAYMRAEGYTKSAAKNHLAKTHSDLKPFAELSEHDKKKDDVWHIALKLALEEEMRASDSKH